MNYSATQYRCLFERMKSRPLLIAGVALKSSRSAVTLFAASCSNLSPTFKTNVSPVRVV